MDAKAQTATHSSLGKPRVTQCQSGQSDRLSPPITYQYLNLSVPGRKVKEEGTMVHPVLHPRTKLSSKEA
jgi:hypothetical protein